MAASVVGRIVRVTGLFNGRARVKVASSLITVVALAANAGLLCQAAKCAPVPAKPAAKAGSKQVGMPAAKPKTGSKQFGAPIGDKWAVVVGVSQFADGAVPSLKYAAKDAKDFYDYLTDPTLGHFKKDHVKLLVNEDATKVNIMDSLGDSFLPFAAGPNDLVVIYLSTHGSPAGADREGLNYVIAYDTNLKRPYSTAISMKELMASVKNRVHTNRKLVVLDTCYSGAGAEEHKGLVRTNFNANALAKSMGSVVITSSAADQRSWESDNLKNSYFTRYLIDTLRAGQQTTIDEVFGQMKDRVQNSVLKEKGEMQTPQMRGSFDSRLALAAPPTAMKEAPLTVATTSDASGSTKTVDLAEYGQKMRLAYQLIDDYKLWDAVHELESAIKANPNSVEANLVSADVYDAQDRFDQALTAAKRAVYNGEKEAKTHVRLARAWFRKGNYDEALRQAEIAVSLDPDNSMAHYWLGYINQVVHHRLDLAEQEYRQALELDGLNGRAMVSLGRLLADQGRELDTIDQYYRKAIAANDDDWEARWELAKYLVRRKNYKEAEQEVRRATKTNPNNAILHSELANIITQSGGKARLAEADGEYGKGLKLGANIGYPHFVYARFLEETHGRLDEAEREYRLAIKLDPQLDEARVRFGDLLLKKRVFDEADGQYRKALETNPKNAEAYLGLAQIQCQLYKNYNGALDELNKALAIRPTYSRAQDLMGTVYHRNLSRHEEARKAFQSAIASDAKAAEPHYHLGMLMLEDVKKKSSDAVLSEFQAAMNLSPSTSLYHTRVGQILSDYYKKFKEAEAEYRKAIDLNIADSEAHYRLGMLMIEKFNQRQAGEKELRTAFEQNPRDPVIKAAFERFAQ
jgi:tetratricopeptide (TPR) repeat protein/uncharacterized caspase-like protein